MKNYELLYILPANITSKEIKTAFLEIEKTILKLGGKKLETLLDHPFLVKAETSKEENVEELKTLPIVKRRIAYPIKNNRVGFYCLFNFSSESDKLKKIDDYLKMHNVVLRHLIIQTDPLSKKGIERLEKLFARKRAEQEKQERQEKEKHEKSKREEKEDEKKKKEDIVKKRKIEIVSEEKVKKEIVKKKPEKETAEEKPKKEKKGETSKKKKIKLEDLEEKLDEILEDTLTI